MVKQDQLQMASRPTVEPLKHLIACRNSACRHKTISLLWASLCAGRMCLRQKEQNKRKFKRMCPLVQEKSLHSLAANNRVPSEEWKLCHYDSQQDGMSTLPDVCALAWSPERCFWYAIGKLEMNLSKRIELPHPSFVPLKLRCRFSINEATLQVFLQFSFNYSRSNFATPQWTSCAD